MYSVTKSFGLNGLRGFAVAVEADVSGGLPAFSIVGLPDSAVRESADRVRAAIKNLGFKFPDRRITVNLAPADVRKTGPVYDLPLLLAVLTASGQLEDVPEDAAFWGTGAGRHPAPGIRRAAHGTGRRRKRHPRPVCARRKRRRGCRGLCRQHGRLPGPHRPGGGGRPARHPTADRCGSRSL